MRRFHARRKKKTKQRKFHLTFPGVAGKSFSTFQTREFCLTFEPDGANGLRWGREGVSAHVNGRRPETCGRRRRLRLRSCKLMRTTKKRKSLSFVVVQNKQNKQRE
ncbi:hypothetical protein NL108_016627 [Boleophthalmus pectinirostris]|nr:hypothetical protein NL108_016627 [Boleophthalmus pectinirostris]